MNDILQKRILVKNLKQLFWKRMKQLTRNAVETSPMLEILSTSKHHGGIVKTDPFVPIMGRSPECFIDMEAIHKDIEGQIKNAMGVKVHVQAADLQKTILDKKETKECKYCRGDGRCDPCGGTGLDKAREECHYCEGWGLCESCNGYGHT